MGILFNSLKRISIVICSSVDEAQKHVCWRKGNQTMGILHDSMQYMVFKKGQKLIYDGRHWNDGCL